MICYLTINPYLAQKDVTHRKNPSRKIFDVGPISSCLLLTLHIFILDNGFFLYSNTTAVGLPINREDVDDDDDGGDFCSAENPDVCNVENQSASTTGSAYDFAPITIRDWW
jgi:hypothetical protein